MRDGEYEDSDLHPGGEPWSDTTSEGVPLSFLYQGDAIGYTCAFAGVRPADTSPITGPPGIWARLPERNYWNRHWAERAIQRLTSTDAGK